MAAPLRDGAAPGRPVIELVGPAGAGKSTVRALVHVALGAAGAPAAGGERSHARTAALALRHAADWLPPAAALVRLSPSRARRLFRHVVRLRTLAAELPRLRAAAPGALLLDEGPVFSLALLSRACELAAVPALARYLEASLATWGTRLDVVVYLDAPDAVLARRIDARAKAHRLKGRSDDELRAFLRWYRHHYAAVTHELAARGVRVLRIDTGGSTADVVATRVAALAEGGAHAH